ncbi:MAG: hypothetical protein KF819_05170 [Labilithrix sp.]|nr:hypothetical protein [Labilithrix sp.]
MIVFRSLIGAACFVALFACNRDRAQRDRELGERPETKTGETKTGETTVTGAHVGVSNDAAIGRLVAARCAREVACKNVGADKHFTTHEVCAKEVRATTASDLEASECPRGVDAKELDECLEAIQKESCTNPIDTISRLAACRTGELCLKTEERPR